MKKFVFISGTSIICLLAGYFVTQIVGKKPMYFIGGGMFVIGSSAQVVQMVRDHQQKKSVTS